jgi:regulator of CtrA degradation
MAETTATIIRRHGMAGKDKRKGKGTAVLMLPGIYNETLKVLVDAHDYFHHHGEREQAQMDERERIMFTSEMSRITIRLSCVMAWLMARKAIFDGRITNEEAKQNYRLDCRDVCMNQHIEAESMLPGQMTELLDKSLELYQRVARLDKDSVS